jgi:hypothetical protein
MVVSNLCNSKEKWQHVVSDLRKLNVQLKHHPIPIPKVGDMICSIERCTYDTVVDLGMVYCYIKLNADVQSLCTIVFPRGNCKNLRLTMGIEISPDVFRISCPSLSKPAQACPSLSEIWNM